MILILSECQDAATDEVCEWLIYYDLEFYRINREENNYCIDITVDDKNIIPILNLGADRIPISSFSTVWFRRGVFSTLNQNIEINCFSSDSENAKIKANISQYCRNEFNAVADYIYYYLCTRAKCFNHPHLYNINKLMVLECAMKVGFNVPQSIITTSQYQLNAFTQVVGQDIITKSITDWSFDIVDNHSIALRTKKVDMIELSESFFYSLFQQQIDKLYEVRIFFWDNKTYSAAIYCPFDGESNIDFRNSVKYEDIRITPYKLPEEIDSKLVALMNVLKLESGSIDMIVDKKHNYHFLEVNPVGQFEFLDKICNYNIPKIIAETLMNNENSR